MSEPFLISVVIPVYNGAKYIPHCMGSVRRAVSALPEADRARIEVILCDNHSSDDTIALAESLKPDCAYRAIQPPQFYDNRCLNWHHGLMEATGDWMMMLHADDMLTDNGLAALLAAIRRPVPSSAVLIQGRHGEFTSETEPVSAPKPRWGMPVLLSGDELRRGPLSFFCPFVPFLLMRRDMYHVVGGLTLRYELIQDWDLWIRLLGRGDLFFTPDVVGNWRVHGTTEKYQRIFMREHLDLAYNMPRLVPGLSEDAARYALTYQIARVRTNFPTEPLDEFLVGVPTDAIAISAAERDEATNNFAAVMERGNKKVSAELMRLRMTGVLRLLAAK